MPLHRRDLLKAAGATGATLGTGGAAALLTSLGAAPAGAQQVADEAPSANPVSVVLLVVDGLRTDEVVLMSQVSELAEQGTYYPQSRAQMVAETTPNHVSMITGMRSDRHGMPGNDAAFVDDNIGLEPRYLQSDTVFTLARRQVPDLVTVAVTSKTYIVAVSKHDRDRDGLEDATDTNEPTVVIPGADFTPDAETASAGIQVSRELNPDFLFLSLGDVDRVGHVDEVGGLTADGPTGAAPAARFATLLNTDNLIRAFVEDLKDRGVWESTVLIFTADHSMDWSSPDSTVSLAEGIAADPELADEVVFALNGGAGLYSLRRPAHALAGERLRRLREIAVALEGVDEALYTRPNPADGGEEHWVGQVRPDWGLTGDRTGDLVLTAADGFRVVGDSAFDNPIPGNHGHTVTLPIPVIVSGGAPIVARQRIVAAPDLGPADRDPGQAENIDTGTTVAWLLGLNPPPGGFDGRVLREAFTARPAPPRAVADAPSLPLFERVAGATRAATTAALSTRAYPSDEDGATAAGAVVIANDRRFPDALAATPLAVINHAPLLLTGGDVLDPVVAEEVRRLGVERAFVAGGTDVLSEQIEEDLAAAGVPREGITRFGGANRYDTARLIGRFVAGVDGASGGGGGLSPTEGTGGGETTFAGEAVLAVGDRPAGDAFADALLAGPGAGRAGRPVLLTTPDDLPDETAAAIRELGVTRLLVAGGNAAINDEIVATLEAEGLLTERLGGANRLETGALLTERAIREGSLIDEVYVVSVADFPDALAAGAIAGTTGGILVGVPPDSLGQAEAPADLLRRRADAFTRVTVVGGNSALQPSLEAEVVALVTERRTRTPFEAPQPDPPPETSTAGVNESGTAGLPIDLPTPLPV